MPNPTSLRIITLLLLLLMMMMVMMMMMMIVVGKQADELFTMTCISYLL
jgi:hypothetical protein